MPLRDAISWTETRAIATDPTARAKCRRSGALASPDVALLRRLSLSSLEREAKWPARTAGLEGA